MDKVILIIEDNDSISSNIKEICELEHFVCLQAPSAETGIKLASEADLILCDIHLNGISGFDAYQILQSNPLVASKPFYFLTALADSVTINKINRLGVKYLLKPFKIQELIDIISQ
jgi:DNA-binding response OmpR family regulator